VQQSPPLWQHASARSSEYARRLLLPVQKFVQTEISSGSVLLLAAVIAIVWANAGSAGRSYEALWTFEVRVGIGQYVLAHTVREWVNDAFMVIFFFVVGLEVKREFISGELAQWQRASLPIFAALGGMIVPALLYAAFNYGQPGARGWGIPMATDIAFALGAMALLGNRVPSSLRVFLLALATVDDIGAILVIALFYSGHLVPVAIIVASIFAIAIVLMRQLGVDKPSYYIPLGVLFWLAVLESGVHATLAGVVLGFLTPVVPLRCIGRGPGPGAIQTDAEATGESGVRTLGVESPADQLIRLIHPWSSFVVLPIFALANAGVRLSSDAVGQAVASSVTWGIAMGLVAGKMIGIVTFSWLAVRLGISRLVSNVRWSQMLGVGLLGGIGFTVSLFISDLAFADPATSENAKFGVLVASCFAGLAGVVALRAASRKPGSKDMHRSGAAV
jgi:Na+:H+ antiporter, NhaA family